MIRIPSLVAACALAALSVGILPAQSEQTAEQVYKNIQVLKGVPASTFMNTMFFQRYALGVSCNYCHVGSEWERDDKPQKVTARKMLRMVDDINKTQFGGKPAVNCVSCHHGSTQPQTDITAGRFSLQDMLGPRPAASPRPPVALPTVDEVLARYIAALGGADTLSKLRNRVSKGNLITSEGGIVPFEDTFTIGPVGWLSVRHFGGMLGDFATGYDGVTGWNSDNRGLTDQRGQALAQIAMSANLENRLDIKRLYTNWSVAGVETVGTAAAVALTATSTLTGRHERLSFDATTGLLLRRSVATESMFGAFATDTYFENYRTIDGITLPTLISEFTPDFGTIRKVTSVEHNATIDRTVFGRPAPRPPRR